MSVVEVLKSRLKSGKSAFPTAYRGKESPNAVVKEKLNKFGGGSIDLTIANDNIAFVTLNQPEKKNAVSGKMMGDLFDVVHKLEKWKEGKGVILRGMNGNFSSGGDLDMAKGINNPDDGFMMATYMGSLLARFQALPLITLAVVEGCGALGGGAELSTACDYRIITEASRGIGFVHGKMGIVPAWGGTGRLVQLIGYRNALKVLASTQIYSPNELLTIGLVDKIISSKDDPHKFAIEWLENLTCVSTNVLKGIKTTALLSRDHDAMDLERRIFAPYWGCEENKAALKANIKHK